MDDELLRQLGALEREDEASHPSAWEGVIAGTRSTGDARALSEGIDDADLDSYAALFTPMGDGETEALVDTLQAALAGRGEDENRLSAPEDLLAGPHSDHDGAAGERAQAPPTDPPRLFALAKRRQPREVGLLSEEVSDGDNDDDDANAGDPHPAAPLSLADARRSRRGWITAITGLVAFAAAFTLWLRPADPPGPAGANTDLSPFSLIVRNETIRFNRSATGDPAGSPPRYRRDSQIHWLLSPDEALTQADSGALTIHAWASSDDGDVPLRSLRLDDTLTVSDSGVVELRGTFGELFGLPPGRWTIQLAVAVGELPEGLDDARRAARERRALLLPPHSLEVID